MPPYLCGSKVTEKNSQWVYVMDSRDKVNAKGPDGALWKVPVLSDECGQATTSAQFYHQPQVVTGLIPLVKLYYIGMADVMSHPHLNWFHKIKINHINILYPTCYN